MPAILFVDDDVANLKVLEVHLRSDFRILTAQNGTDGLALLERGEDDIGLVVADQRMAGMTGVELLTLVRKRFPDVGRMLITAFADLDPVIAGINQGQISGYIRKPWNPVDVRILLRSGLERVMLKRRLRLAELELLSTQRDAILGFVGSGVGHELNQPAVVLRMNLEALRNMLQDWDAGSRVGTSVAEVGMIVKDCLDAVDSIALISADLRVLSSPRGTAEATEMNLAVQRALRFTDAHLRIRADVQLDLEELPKVRADEAGLTQVLVNLLAHSLQYLNGEKGAKRTTLSIRSELRDGHISVTIRDDGEGIPSEDLERIFDSILLNSEDEKGFRIGLALSRNMVASWGGELRVASVMGVGTEYTLRLKPAPVKLSVVRSTEDPQGQNELPRVLVVDDEPAVLRAVQRILRGLFQVEVADSGKKALELLGKREFQAVLCDLQMPHPDGVAIYEQVVGKNSKLASRFAFMTGGALTGPIASFLERIEKRGLVVLDKPFDQRQVRQLMLELVGRGD